MPIRPQFRWLYPIDWRELSSVIRFERAQSRCERCRRPHGQVIQHRGDGRWWDEADGTWRNGRGHKLKLKGVVVRSIVLRTTKVFLATAHLDHDPTNNHPRNLRALCQRCHMIHDREEHLRRRAMTYKARRALGDLFTGLYRAF
jgi:hypothetical protein